jgi:SAM-dependent methyltransferase
MRQMKQQALQAVRSLGLLDAAELVNRRWRMADATAENEAFCREHPDFTPPPLTAMHDAYGTVSFRAYWELGQYMATLLAGLIRKHQPRSEHVLEWGCGPARIIRHLPALLPGTQFVGTDYNAESIAWCRSTIKNIEFADNSLFPPLPFAGEQFDVVYAISVLTHLSVVQQDDWIEELRRILRPGGCLILTTNGERAASILLPSELRRLDNDGVLIRGRVQEGKRCYLSYHRPEYARGRLFAGLQVCEHIPGLPGAPATEQDIWILKTGAAQR